MIWYLLYPFRGTTEPPVLASEHPIRHAFTKHGNRAARHPTLTLLISVAVASILIYPFPFLYTNNFTNGASNLPHHVWTSAQPFEGSTTVRPDVVMRSIWVHGSYMKALQSNVLQSALEIQDKLLGPTANFDPRTTTEHPDLVNPLTDMTPAMRDSFHAINGWGNSSWFFHSPLQYWSGSAQAIADDQDIISAVNRGSRQATSVNVTLRHSIVFSGKRFEDHRLVAADALVITLLHSHDSAVGRQWERKAEELALTNSPKWRLYPADGRSIGNTLYEFRFQPLSWQDDILLVIVYVLISLYFCKRLTELRAVKTRFGLILAVMVQIAVSILSSFTICAVFKIDLSKIPRECYPLVILAVGLENIFRFINAVIVTPSRNSTPVRMGEALGQTGHIALAGVAQNLVILFFLQNVIAPAMSAFCTFAMIALIFDFFYLITYFAAVLSVDVQRTELSDSLTRVAYRNEESLTPDLRPRRTWIGALLSGSLPSSTRVAGTVVMVGFVLMAQTHFFENETSYQVGLRLVRWAKSETQLPRSSASRLSVDINQARTPTAWLRLQDHETAREVIQVIKPHASSYIAQVYEPLILVLNGSDRTPNHSGIRPFLPAAYDFIKHQWRTFFVAIILAMAAVSLLMNYLLWDELPEVEERRPEDEPLISVKTLTQGHTLDVVLLATSRDGVIVTVGLDRWIRIWNVRTGIMSYLVHDPETPLDPFPVLAVTIDTDSNWLALLSAKNRVFLWNIPERRWGPSIEVQLKGRTPVAFCFGYNKIELIKPLIVVQHNGMMSVLHAESNEKEEVRICHSPLVTVRAHLERPNAASSVRQRMITSSKRGCVHIASESESGWESEGIEIAAHEDDKSVLSILPLPILSAFLAVRSHTVELVDIATHDVTHTFETKSMVQDSLRCFHSSRRAPQCGSVGLASFALAYTCADTGNLILQSYLPRRENDIICFRNPLTPRSKTCCLWRETVERSHIIENPGRWEALQTGYLVGVRKRVGELAITGKSRNIANSSTRRRGVHPRSIPTTAPIPESDLWEVWSLSSRGEKASAPLCGYNEHNNLLISSLGPLEKVGKKRIAIGFGNVVKVITIGNEKYNEWESEEGDSAFMGMPPATVRRKRPVMTRKRTG